jgi:CRP-like cAMP-binding protein
MSLNNRPHHPNSLLNALPVVELERLTPHLTPCLFHQNQTLYEKGQEVKRVYFPKCGAISLVLGDETGMDVEIGMIGREGALGTIEALACSPLSTRAEVQMAGSGWYLPADVLRLEYARNSRLQQVILLSAHSLNQQTSQGVLCNRLHSLEQRLARWLLMREDRMNIQNMELTQEFLSHMLGARREGVTLAAGVLREAKLIEYSRGCIKIIDRPGLEKRACECYNVLRSSLKSLQPPESHNGPHFDHSPHGSLLNENFPRGTMLAPLTRSGGRF